MNKIFRNKVLIVSTSTKLAGIGGVSVHTERLLQWLEHDNVQVDFCDYKGLSFRSQFRMILQHRIIHFHISNPVFRVAYLLLTFITHKKSILTIHGNLGRYTMLKNMLDYFAIMLCTKPIVLNKTSYSKAIRWNKKCIVIPAFIPPMDDNNISEGILNIIKRAENKTKILTNASARNFTDSGEEIYGIDFLIKFFSRRNKYALFISDPSGQYEIFYNSIQFSNIFFITERHSFYSLLKFGDIMIRATATDGDSLSVKEALSLKKNVIATDCVERPEGVITYKYNNEDSLLKALNNPIKQKNEFVADATVSEIERIYKEFENK